MSALQPFNFVGQRAVFLVLARLELLERVFFDQLFLGLDFKFEFLAAGFYLFDFVFGALQTALRARSVRLK